MSAERPRAPVFPILEHIAADIEPYFAEYGAEMRGLAEAYGATLGDVVMMNLVYQLEGPRLAP